MADNKGRFRAKLTDDMIAVVRRRLRKGDLQHDIAADLGINQGRVSEIKTGKRGAHVTA